MKCYPTLGMVVEFLFGVGSDAVMGMTILTTAAAVTFGAVIRV